MFYDVLCLTNVNFLKSTQLSCMYIGLNGRNIKELRKHINLEILLHVGIKHAFGYTFYCLNICLCQLVQEWCLSVLHNLVRDEWTFLILFDIISV